MSGFFNALGSAVFAAAILPVPALADGFSKFGFSQQDVNAYMHLSYAPCMVVRQENKDPMKPTASADSLRHFAHLYAACQGTLEKSGARVELLRVNDMFLGMTCLALGAVDTNDPVDDACNINSYIPNQ